MEFVTPPRLPTLTRNQEEKGERDTEREAGVGGGGVEGNRFLKVRSMMVMVNGGRCFYAVTSM